MMRPLLWLAALAVGCGSALAAPATAVPAQQLVERGGCAACHGADLDRPADAATPRLAGQHADYLRSAMRAYRMDATPHVGRDHPVMKAMLAPFTSAEIDRIADYIANLPGRQRRQRSPRGLPLQRGRLRLAAMAAGFTAARAEAVQDLPGGPAVRQLDLHAPATAIAADQVALHGFMLLACMVIFVLVFGVMFYSIWKHRKSRGYQPASFHESVPVEVLWTAVPFVIVILMALPATKVMVAAKDTSNADVTIKATGYQWKWGYDYLTGDAEGVSFLASIDRSHRELSDTGANAPLMPDDYLLKVDNPLVVPVGRKIRIITTASDVIHAWGVPAFGVKQDAIPGFVRDTWFRSEKTGDFYGQCYELCGKEHAYMPIHVKVVTAEEFQAWAAAQRQRMAAQRDRKEGA